MSDRRINEANVKETNFSSQTLLNNSPKIKGGQIDASINLSRLLRLRMASLTTVYKPVHTIHTNGKIAEDFCLFPSFLNNVKFISSVHSTTFSLSTCV